MLTVEPFCFSRICVLRPNPSYVNSVRLVPAAMPVSRSTASHSYVLVELAVTHEIRFPFKSYESVLATGQLQELRAKHEPAPALAE